jgi:hypothetical protein
MWKKKDFIGMDVMQGSPGYCVPEVIKDITHEPKDFVKVLFESGFYTQMTWNEFDTFAEDSEVQYERRFGDGVALETMRKRWK